MAEHYVFKLRIAEHSAFKLRMAEHSVFKLRMAEHWQNIFKLNVAEHSAFKLRMAEHSVFKLNVAEHSVFKNNVLNDTTSAKRHELWSTVRDMRLRKRAIIIIVAEHSVFKTCALYRNGMALMSSDFVC